MYYDRMKKYSTGIPDGLQFHIIALPGTISFSWIFVELKDISIIYYIIQCTHGRRPRLIGRRNIEQKLKTCIVFKNRN